MVRETRLCTQSLVTLALSCLTSVQAEERVLAEASHVERKAPEASTAVQEILDEAARLRESDAPEDALAAAARASESARAADDSPGLALAAERQAGALAKLERVDEALTAWSAANRAWEAVGDGPGRIRATCARALLLAKGDKDAGLAELERAAELGAAEQARPLAAARELALAGATTSRLRWTAGSEAVVPTALELRERHAPGSLEHGKSLGAMCWVAYDAHDLAAARRFGERALELEEKHGVPALDLAQRVLGLGHIAGAMGDLAASGSYQERALEIRERHAPNSLDLAHSLNNLGNVALRKGDMTTAGNYHQRALKIREDLAPDSMDLAVSLLGLGNVALGGGDLATGRSLFERGEELLQRHDPGSLNHGGVLISLCGVAAKQGDLDEARAFGERGLEISEKLGHPGYVSGALTSLASVTADEGDRLAARSYLERALELNEQFAPDSRTMATILTNLGGIVSFIDGPEAARGYLERALEIDQRIAPGSLAVALSLDNFGVDAFNRGDHEEAISYGERSLEIRQRLAPGSLDVAQSLVNLAKAHHEQGDLAAARGHHERALEIYENQSPDSLVQARVLTMLAGIDWAENDLVTAEQRTSRAWKIVRAHAGSVVGDEARQAFGAEYRYQAEGHAFALLNLNRKADAFEVVEQSRAQSLLEVMAVKEADLASAAPEAWTKYSKAEALMQREGSRLSQKGLALARAERGAAPPEQLDALRAEVEAARSDHAAARSYMQRHLATARAALPGLQGGELKLDEARRVLPLGAVLVSFLVYDTQALGFLVSADPREAVMAWAVLLPMEELSSRVAQVRAVVERPLGVRGVILDSGSDSSPPRRVRRADRASAHRELFQLLFPEKVRQRVMAAERLVLSPDGVLWELPFAALITNESGKPSWLGLEKPLSYTQSLTVLALEGAAPRAEPRPAPKALVVGDVVFERGQPKPVMTLAMRGSARPSQSQTSDEVMRSQLWLGDGPPRRLPATRDEARVVSYLHGAQAILGEAATEAAVRAQLAEADLVHLATHGTYLPFAPMSSGVLLTPPLGFDAGAGEVSTDDDGALQAWEILRGPRLRAELVVLSACDTGRGRAVKGEGLVGLTRAWQGAGARSVLATHWPVADESTAAVMMSFHQGLREGLAKDEALRRAVKDTAMRKESREPFYWASFFLSGDSRPVPWSKSTGDESSSTR